MILNYLIGISIHSPYDSNDLLICGKVPILPQESLQVPIIQETLVSGITGSKGSFEIPVIPSLHLQLEALQLQMKVDLPLEKVS